MEMNDRGNRTPNDDSPAGGSSRAQGRRTGNGTRPRAFLGDTTGGVSCGVCDIPLPLGHRAVRFHVGKGATCSMLVVWLRPLREARHWHHYSVQRSTAEPGIPNGTHWRQRSKPTRVFAIEWRG